jgi:hypothetical protein
MLAGCAASKGTDDEYRFTFTLDPPLPRAGSTVNVHVEMEDVADLSLPIYRGHPTFDLHAGGGILTLISGETPSSGFSYGDYSWQLPAGEGSAVLLARHGSSQAMQRFRFAP